MSHFSNFFLNFPFILISINSERVRIICYKPGIHFGRKKLFYSQKILYILAFQSTTTPAAFSSCFCHEFSLPISRFIFFFVLWNLWWWWFAQQHWSKNEFRIHIMHFLMVADDVDSIDFPSATISQCLKISKMSHLQFSFHQYSLSELFGNFQNL